MMEKSRLGTFGQYVEQTRLSLRLTLKDFAKKSGLDVGHVSRVERGKERPPQDRDTLKQYADALELDYATFEMLVEYAEAEADEPEFVPTEGEDLLNALPVCYRTEEGERPSRKQMDRLVEKIKSY